MLTLQIAGGIVLAAIVLRFWRQSLLAALAVIALAIVVAVVLLGSSHWVEVATTAGFYGVIAGIIWGVRRGRKTILGVPPDHRP